MKTQDSKHTIPDWAKEDLVLLERLAKHDLDDGSKKFLRHVITHQLKEYGEDKAFDTLFNYINGRTGTEIIKYTQSLQSKHLEQNENMLKAFRKIVKQKDAPISGFEMSIKIAEQAIKENS